MYGGSPGISFLLPVPQFWSSLSPLGNLFCTTTYREGEQVKKRTLANLSKLPDDIIDNLKLALKGATLSMTEGIPNHFEVIRS